jgi:hypothetical protein
MIKEKNLFYNFIKNYKEILTTSQKKTQYLSNQEYFFFLKNFKKIIKFELNKKKKLLSSFKKDQKYKKINRKEKKKLFIEIIEKIHKSKNLNTHLFSFFFLGIKLGCFFSILKLIFKFFFKEIYPDYFWIILTLWEFERKKKILLSQEYIFKGILKNFFTFFLSKEYFRFKLFFFKLIFGYYKFTKNYKLDEKKFFAQKNFLWLNLIFKKIIWSFFSKNKDCLFFENLLQISGKEIWLFNSIFFLYNCIFDLMKKIIIDHINFIENFKFFNLPKKLSSDNILFKNMCIRFFYIFIFFPGNQIFNYLIEKKKIEKKNSLKNFYFLNTRNFIQVGKIEFF